jgi:CDP-glycerol glycerophosphotransferase
MAAFSFESGNLRALRDLPRYLLGSAAGLVVPRTDRLWVFGSGIGLGEGALPLLRRAREELPDDVRLVWLASTPEELRDAVALGLDAEAKNGRRGWWLTTRATVVVVTHGMGDVNRFGVGGAFVVQLWHGIALKRLHLDSDAALRAPGFLPSGAGRRLMEFAYRRAGRRIRLFPVSSERVVDRISSAFGIPADRIAVTGDPRDDVLLQPGAEDVARRRLAELVPELPSDASVVLYAPTWRDGEVDPSVPDDATWSEIAAWLEATDSVLLLRTHPLGSGDYTAGVERSPRIRLLGADLLADVTPILPAVDALVTDYSSIVFDYSLAGGPVVFLAPDVSSYARTRGLYERYATFSGGHVVSWRQVLTLLTNLRTPQGLAAARAHSAWIRDEFFDHTDGRSTERVLAEILRRRGRTSGARTAAGPAAGTSRPRVTGIQLRGDSLRLELDRRVPGARLSGARAAVEGVLDASGTLVDFPLLATRWGSAALALPTGGYRLTLLEAHPSTRVSVAPGLQLDELHERFRVRAKPEDGGLVVRIGPPLRDGESGQRASLRQRWTYALPRRRLENAVYLESFYGRTASCNPLGIDRVLARTHPQVRRYWSVADGSVPLPEGAVRLVEGTAEWWRVRAEARALVINDWLRWTHRPRRHQHVLQTWHGTMLKRLALDRSDVSARRRFATVRQGRRWNALIAQNHHSAEIFRTSYAFRGPIWETGYPRNDVFADPARSAGVRAVVGIAPDARVVLYAPTWRDDQEEMVDYLDLVTFAAALPPDHVVLVRGHSRTLTFGADLHAAKVVDVTSYPDVADLMLVADVLVTDYSSVMFDFAATNKPMVFFTPDLEHYQDVLRGFYFDLLADAPGPVVETQADLLDTIKELDAVDAAYATRRAAWRDRFAPYDDGHAGERVVEHLVAAGWLDPG